MSGGWYIQNIGVVHASSADSNEKNFEEGRPFYVSLEKP